MINNLLSIAFGIISIVVLFIGFVGNKRTKIISLMFISLSCCMISIVIHMYYLNQLVLVGDFSSLQDIYPVSVIISITLMVIVICFNAFLLFRYKTAE